MNAIRIAAVAALLALPGCASTMVADAGCMRPAANTGLEEYGVTDAHMLDSINVQLFGKPVAASLAMASEQADFGGVITEGNEPRRTIPGIRTVGDWRNRVCVQVDHTIMEAYRGH